MRDTWRWMRWERCWGKCGRAELGGFMRSQVPILRIREEAGPGMPTEFLIF